MSIEKIYVELTFPEGGVDEWLLTEVDAADMIFDGWNAQRKELLAQGALLNTPCAVQEQLDIFVDEHAISFVVEDDMFLRLGGTFSDDHDLVDALSLIAVLSSAAGHRAEGNAHFLFVQQADSKPTHHRFVLEDLSLYEEELSEREADDLL